MDVKKKGDGGIKFKKGDGGIKFGVDSKEER